MIHRSDIIKAEIPQYVEHFVYFNKTWKILGLAFRYDETCDARLHQFCYTNNFLRFNNNLRLYYIELVHN